MKINLKSTIAKILVLTIILGSITCMFTGVVNAETAESSVVYSDDFENGIGDWVFSEGAATVSDGKLNLKTGAQGSSRPLRSAIYRRRLCFAEKEN